MDLNVLQALQDWIDSKVLGNVDQVRQIQIYF